MTSVAQSLMVGWTARAVPLAPVAVAANNAVVSAALLRRALRYSDDVLAQWAGVAVPSGTAVLLALRPDAPPLPWVDGVFYLGRDSPAALYLPTALQPTVPGALLYRALRRQFPDVEEPFAVWPSHPPGDLIVFSLHEARALDRKAMASWEPLR